MPDGAENVQDITWNSDSEETLKDIFGKGGKDNTIDSRITIASVNDGNPILTPKQALKMDNWCVANRGKHCDGTSATSFESADEKKTIFGDYYKRLDKMIKVVTFGDIEDPTELKIKASAYLLDNLQYPAEITASSIDMAWSDLKWSTFKLSQLVKVEFPGWKSDYNWQSNPFSSDETKGMLRITKLEIDIDKGTKKITLGTPKHKDLTEIVKEVNDEAKNKSNNTKVMTSDNYDAMLQHDDNTIYYLAGDLGDEE